MSSPPCDVAGDTAAAGVCPPLTIGEVNPLASPDWDSVVATLPGATFFHGRAWAAVLHAAYGFAPRYLIARPLGDVTPRSRLLPTGIPLEDATTWSHFLGVLPLVEVRSWLTGRRGVSLPFTDACAPIATSEEISHRLFRAALERSRSSRWRYCEIRGGRETIGAPASLTFYGHTIDLRPGLHELWARLPSAVCRAVRKAEANGVKVEFTTSPDAAQAFYGLLCRTRRRHGLPPPPRRFFDAVHRHAIDAGSGTIVLARYNNQPVAGAVYFNFGRTALYKFGASNERFLHLRPNNLVMARAIEHYAQLGFETLDLGRTSMTNDGLRQFKRHWNAQEHVIEYVRYDCHRNCFVTSRDSSTGWHSALFRHLPLGLSRLIGALAYRHVA